MSKAIDYRTTRALQICVVFIATLLIQRLLDFSHAGWIGFAVMMIYAGFDSGASLHRTMHRFWGAMLGLFLTYILFFFIRIDDDLIYVVIPVTIFMAYFSLSKYYVAPTIFTVTLTGLGSDYYQSNLYAIDQFFFDYTKATTIALSICVFFEYFIFKKKSLTHKFYFDLQRALVSELHGLLEVVTTKPVRRSNYLRLSAQFNTNILKLHAFLKTAEHDYHLRAHLFDEIETFNTIMKQVYQNIRQLFVSSDKQLDVLVMETRYMLDQLTTMSHGDRSLGD
ncbi:MAG: FUSC family protein [Gammaproteobacteria bacterium]|nr:FUSC family protein [Gammaproteobacteria bacterium]